MRTCSDGRGSHLGSLHTELEWRKGGEVRRREMSVTWSTRLEGLGDYAANRDIGVQAGRTDFDFMPCMFLS